MEGGHTVGLAGMAVRQRAELLPADYLGRTSQLKPGVELSSIHWTR